MTIEIRDPGLRALVGPEARFERVASGFDFLEGPIWHPVERAVIFSDILGNSIHRWSTSHGLSVLRRNSYMANGNAYDSAGRIVTCEHATSRLTRWDPGGDGALEVLATHYDGRSLNSPNDVVVARDGAIYFTDPTSGRSAAYGVPREPELPFSGVYRLDPETGTLALLVDDFEKPNGLCFSRDGNRLYVNDTVRQHIRRFEVEADGTLSHGTLFARLEGERSGVADGMKIDANGNVYCCGPGGIHIFDPEGRCLGVLLTPEYATNFVFGDDDLQTLYVTASTSLYRIRLRVAGHPTFVPVARTDSSDPEPVADMGRYPDFGDFPGRGPRRQSLRGFDSDYVDIVDYIIRCTHRIWEDRAPGHIHSHYAEDVRIETSDGIVRGVNAVVAASLQTMAAFPDVRLYGDDVIWGGDDEAGFHTSHRIFWVARNLGAGRYGPPTGRRIARYGIAHCLVRENRIVEEWIARDEMALVLQLGLEPHALARRLAGEEAAAGRPHPLADRPLVSSTPSTAPEDVVAATHERFDVLWNRRRFDRLAEFYTSGLRVDFPAGRVLWGRAVLRAALTELLAPFSDATVEIDHVAAVGGGSYRRVATRWTLRGTHSGAGRYGPPTGRPIAIMGISHQIIEGGRVRREWCCFDEFALLKQLYRPD